ncbi:hypothetical protein PG993_014184 [Apiospora rasikravindrae]|uniref:DUF6546 domain-containing protein n=1 Tax=Apiospora rasikravindrae TaxID=990691 RepID=A0ABR1RSF6_9PEZI
MGFEWNDFPQEIRLLIFEALIQDGCSLGPLATVSREWQMKIEQHNFARIKLTPSRLPELDSMTRRNRALVDYIWICLELEDYDCTGCKSCMWSVDGELVKGHAREYRDHGNVTGIMHYLFYILGTWDPSGHLTLDISIHSPSDSKHWFKYLTFMPDTPADKLVGRGGHSIEEMISNSTYHDPHHGWVAGVRHFAPPKHAFRRVFRTIMPWWAELPSVPAVTSLLLRQQTRRKWTEGSLALMVACFPRLEEIHHEPWRHKGSPWKPKDADFRHLVDALRRSNKSLKKLVIFENFNQRYPYPGGRNSVRSSHPASSWNLVMVSRRLEHLAASFVVDASHFFDLKSPKKTWPRLTSLVLTSNLLTPGTSSVETGAMLQAAAAAAMRMPKLEMMEIWNGRKGLAALFQYQAPRDIRPATITWRGTWELAMKPAVIQAWEAVVHLCGGWRLYLVREQVDEAVIKSHADAIHHLKLAGQVMRPISLLQIRAEQKALERLPMVE